MEYQFIGSTLRITSSSIHKHEEDDSTELNMSSRADRKKKLERYLRQLEKQCLISENWIKVTKAQLNLSDDERYEIADEEYLLAEQYYPLKKVVENLLKNWL